MEKTNQQRILQMHEAIARCPTCKGMVETHRDKLCPPCKQLDTIIDGLYKEINDKNPK